MYHTIINSFRLILFSFIFFGLNPSIVYPETLFPVTEQTVSVQFNGQGLVDSISLKRKSISIDDRQFRYTSDMCFHVSSSQTVSISTLKEGDQVGYILNSKKTITSIWLLKTSQKPENQKKSKGKI
jgi:hypothetical protein